MSPRVYKAPVLITKTTNNAISYPDEPGLREPDSLHFFRIVKEQPNETQDEMPWGHLVLNFGITGGANRDRTGDLLLAKQALSQLSYGPDFVGVRVGPWWVWVDLNHRPHAYQACALTN